MKIGLIDVDGKDFPNMPLMKISAWHKRNGDHVEWYNPMFSGHMDKVYMSKVFSFTDDYPWVIDADEIEKGGTGYCISLVDGKEVFDKSKHKNLPYEIEHIYPDYSIYPELTGYGKPLKEQTAYGFLSRGCPRGCDFCHVKDKEGRCATKVADLSEFWNGQKNIVLCDPNILAVKEWKDLLQQLINSGARVDFNQGLDIRLMTDEKARMLSQIKIDKIHFAWDRYEDKDIVQPRFLTFRKQSTVNNHKLQVYVLCGDHKKELLPEDIYRVQWLKDNGYAPYVMLYDKEHLSKGCDLRRFQRYVNNRFVFWKCNTWEGYMKGGYDGTGDAEVGK